MAATSAKKEKLDPNSSVSSLKIDGDMIAQFDDVQQELDRVNEESGRAILGIEQKYSKLRQPLFQKRAEHIAKIQNFWLVTFSNHPQTSELISDEDEKALSYLSKVEVEDFEDIKSGYKLHFHFKENPFFSNKTLTREFTISEDGSSTTKSTPVNWKPGKSLLSKPEKKGQKEKHQTFFDWFTTGDKNNFDEIGEAIKEEIWTNPLHFFLMEEDGMEDEEDDDEDVEEDEENLEEDDDEEDEEEDS